MDEIIAILGLMAFSGLKFFFAVPATVLAGYSYFPAIFITAGGGIIGFILFFYIGELKWVRIIFGTLMNWIFKLFGVDRMDREKKIFSRKNRLIVTVKGRYGLIGLALLTPCVFSIPLGSLIAARYYDNRSMTIPYMILSIILWSFILTTFYEFFR